MYIIYICTLQSLRYVALLWHEFVDELRWFWEQVAFKALFTLCSGSVKALFTLYSRSVKALFTLY